MSISFPTFFHSSAAQQSGFTLSARTRARVYTLGLCLAAVVAGLFLGLEIPSDRPVYAPLAAAMIVGALLSVRSAYGEAPSTFALIPAQVAYADVGGAALVPFVLAGVLGGLVRGARVGTILTSAAQDLLSFAVAFGVAHALVPGEAAMGSAVFALTLTSCRWGLWRLGACLDVAAARDQAGQRPDLVLWLGLVPIGLLPIAAANRLGEGALLLSLAALFCVLFLVREVANGTAARAHAETRSRRLVDAGEVHHEVVGRLAAEIDRRLAETAAAARSGRAALEAGDTHRALGLFEQVELSSRAGLRLVESVSGLPTWSAGE
jgi:hypothetical protein